MASEPDLREVVYELFIDWENRPPALVLGLMPEATSLQVETLATNLDLAGNLWRLMAVRGDAAEVAEAERRFRARPIPGLLQRRILSSGPGQLVLWTKYRAGHPHRGRSLTAWTLKTLGPETVITDRTSPTGLRVRVLAPQSARLRRFLARLPAEAEHHHTFRLLYVGPPRFDGQGRLTADEERTLREARQAGLFEVPRRGSMRSLARTLGCSPSAASARLRRATAKLLESHAG
ncbi:MAG: helix-turn-helix domain-containing protein [Thermoplasmatota archaeon]